MPPEQFREFGTKFIGWIADYLENIEQHAVLPNVKPSDIRTMLPESPPESGETMHHILADIDKIIMSGMTHWNHPGFFAYFAITGSGPGILGELLSAAFNINGMLWKTCPASTELEQTTLDWLRQMLGLPEEFWGIIYDTASISSMHAIAAAREQLADWQIREKGLSGRSDLPRLRLYTSEHAHSSIDKAAITLGIGLEGIRKIPVDEKYQMRVDALDKAIEEDRESGWRPFCVVATVGTTSTTSIDPVAEIAEICQQEDVWLHVDAAYGGSAAVVPEMRHVLAGCERADSVVVNPHKWLFVPVDLSAFFTRKPDVLKRAFSLVPEYLRTSEDSKVENFMDYGLQLGRRFRALKLWFVLRYFGTEGIAERIRHHIKLAQEFAKWVDEHADFERMAPVPFSSVCFRAHPKNMQDQMQLNALNERLVEAVNGTGEVFLSHTKLNGDLVLRLAVGNLRTEERHVGRVWEILSEKLKRIQKHIQVDRL
ncbi:amino acid decarboxylase [candidate division KSB1 bacterium]|nr:amino acid decarboxylase [candidate division KSB1 bacterium]NIR70274.1 amino acid decarboxylase [candidate division KSB1 bacterium]NIS26544.1 amino acid decarboxylase [candidate division KSB1 bacterium]NIT73307.1 amino acid decarboxylase [candidate division KSB1 bacterium]NIU23930.1 amino acid decarboxylase [candidate division KSB1 bacterium]